MSGTSESELRSMLRDLGVGGTFIGTFDNSFRGFAKSSKPQCCIVNTGSRNSGGVHWIACGVVPREKRIYTFDPLGWSDGELKRLYNFSYKPFIYKTFDNFTAGTRECFRVERNTEAVQCSCSGSCGLFCLLFIYCFYHAPWNVSAHGIIQMLNGQKAKLYPSEWKNLHDNQEKLYDFLRSRSAYFRNNELEIKRNTRTGLIKTHA